MGALSFSPSPITTTPRIDTELTSSRMASTAAPSPPSLSPRPTQRPAAIAPASVTRTNSSARLRSGASRPGRDDEPLARRTSEDEPVAPGASEDVMAAHSPTSGSDFGSWDTGDVTTPAAAPGPKPAKSRLLQDGRDMFWSMAPLVLACIVLAGLLGMCSFAPEGPGQGPLPPYDTPAAMKAD